MTIAEILDQLRARGVELRAKNGKLLLNAPAGALTEDLQEELRQRKPELLALLSGRTDLKKLDQAKLPDHENQAPLSFSQQRLWLIDRFAPGSIAYNIPQFWNVDGPIDIEAVKLAIGRLAIRHGALRTRIELRHGEPVQLIADHVDIPLDFTDLSEIAEEAGRQAQVSSLLVQEGRRPFALEQSPLIRFHILRLAPERHVVFYCIHHIVADQWSLGIIKRDLVAMYAEITTGRPALLPRLPIEYSEVAEQERREAASHPHAAEIAYWRKRLFGMPTLLDLPFSRSRPARQTTSGETLSLTIDAARTTQLRQLAVRHGTTLYLLMLTIFATLIYRYTGQQEMCLGSPITGRKRREEEDVVGLFLNMLPLRCSVDPRESFNALLKRTSSAILADFEYSDIPFQRLVMELHPERSSSQTPFFQVMFALNPRGPEAAGQGDAGQNDEDHAQQETFTGVSKFDLSLQIAEHTRTLEAHFEYRSDLFNRADIDRFGRHFVQLAASVVDAPEQKAGSLALLTPDDHDAMQRWNATELSYDRNQTLIGLFERQVAELRVAGRADALALCCGETTLTYAELHKRVALLAASISALGVHRGRSGGSSGGRSGASFVGICLDRSANLIIAMLAVLKAGAAYLPLDPRYPEERLSFMLQDSGARFMIAERNDLTERLAQHHPGLTVLCSGDELPPVESVETTLSEPAAHPADPAYLIYTSGSTGKPKGVVVEHRNAVALIAWAKNSFDHDSLRGVLASTSVCFDLSVFEIFLPLSLGTTVVLVNDLLGLLDLRSPDAAQVTLINTVPSAMKALLRVGFPPSVRTVCMAGELLPQDLVELVYAAGVERVFDLYGPTETTTYSTRALRLPGGVTNIGKPIANTRVYLLDESLSLVPPGALGEIFIGGDGVTRGYLDRPELTAERFVKLPPIDAGRFYRTGDLARQLLDGSLVFHGRRDGQVKLRGHRIELGEIEAALREISCTSDLAVVVQNREAGDTLVAFLKENEGSPIDARACITGLRQRLPAYMVPAMILAVPALPLTPNGKIDRRALSLLMETGIDRSQNATDHFEAARDLLEQWLANIWALRLGRKTVARNAHFFDDLGGHSLVAFEIFHEIECRLGTVMGLAVLFQSPTVELLATGIRRLGWKQPKYISFLVAGRPVAGTAAWGATDAVIYVVGAANEPLPIAAESMASSGERVMMVAVKDSHAIEDLAREMASFEAARPPLILAGPATVQENARRLAASLSAAGFGAVSLRVVEVS